MKINYSIKNIHRILSLILIIFLVCGVSPVYAQQATPDGPIYIVQSGDTLSSIADAFAVTLDALVTANNITDVNNLAVGAQLVIPGLEGVTGLLVGQKMPLGETLRSFARHYQVPMDTLNRLNHIVSPGSVFAGSSLIVPQAQAEAPAQKRFSDSLNQTALELAAVEGVNPWTLIENNQLDGSWDIYPEDILYIPTDPNQPDPGVLFPGVKSLEVDPLPIIQGKTTVLRVNTTGPVTLTGSLDGHDLHFFPDGENSYVALQGIHAMAEPGLVPFSLEGQVSDGTSFHFEQRVILASGNYLRDVPLQVDETLVDPTVTKPEEDKIFELTAPFDPQKMWNGIFQSPSPYTDCFNSTFGLRRSFNGSDYIYYHAGVDFCGGEGVQITAPAAGVVVFTGPLNVRGNATIISHGWGVYTGYWHQEKILVNVGDTVEPGQVIGLVGATGRVEGAHLHWEMIVGGVQVNPLDWLQRAYP